MYHRQQRITTTTTTTMRVSCLQLAYVLEYSTVPGLFSFSYARQTCTITDNRHTLRITTTTTTTTTTTREGQLLRFLQLEYEYGIHVPGLFSFSHIIIIYHSFVLIIGRRRIRCCRRTLISLRLPHRCRTNRLAFIIDAVVRSSSGCCCCCCCCCCFVGHLVEARHFS